jgi:hypothetical protein
VGIKENVGLVFNGDSDGSYDYVMNAHGSLIEVPRDGSPPGKSRTLLRGNFSIVEFSSRTRSEPEVFMVLQGLEPGNRKLVYKMTLPSEKELLDSHVIIGAKTQDSPGMARNGWEKK